MKSRTPHVSDSPIRSPYHVAFGEKNIYGRRALGDGVDGGLRGKNRKATIMRSSLIFILTYGIILLSVSSCATVPTEPLGSCELRLLSMHVPMREEIKLNFPFVVNINFEADGTPEIRTACFYFSGDGPYCVKATDVTYGLPGTIRVQVRAKMAGTHALEGYVFYVQDGRTKQTNMVGRQIRIIP